MAYGTQRSSRRRLTRVAASASASAQPVSTSVARPQGSSPRVWPGVVIATAAPVGSHLARACGPPSQPTWAAASVSYPDHRLRRIREGEA
jgi:hypothetical protein